MWIDFDFSESIALVRLGVREAMPRSGATGSSYVERVVDGSLACGSFGGVSRSACGASCRLDGAFATANLVRRRDGADFDKVLQSEGEGGSVVVISKVRFVTRGIIASQI